MKDPKIVPLPTGRRFEPGVLREFVEDPDVACFCLVNRTGVPIGRLKIDPAYDGPDLIGSLYDVLYTVERPAALRSSRPNLRLVRTQDEAPTTRDSTHDA